MSDAGPTADEVLSRLKEGNARFVRGEATGPQQGTEDRAALAGGQSPIVTILSCSDSRVPPELVFDAGLGELFVIRVAGNVADNDVIASVEYGVDHLHTPLVIVMGHQNCGAVTAAVQRKQGPIGVSTQIDTLLDRIDPALDGLSGSEIDLDEAIEANVRHGIATLKAIQPIEEGVFQNRFRIMGAVYSLETGEVHFLDD